MYRSEKEVAFDRLKRGKSRKGMAISIESMNENVGEGGGLLGGKTDRHWRGEG